MSYLVLARKHRPQAFEEVIGQDHVTQTLKNAIQSDRVAHALLFSGPRGVGKTSVARIMAKAMNCAKGPTTSPCNMCPSCKEITESAAMDVFEIDGASNRGIDEIRELRENIKYMPSRSRFKIYIIDEVHMLTAPAFNALLKTLEEPPSHVLFFFATTEPHKIPTTILSRCQRHNFKRIGLEQIVASLQQVCQKSSFQISAESLQLLAQEAGGSMRDALSLLDQIMAYSETAISHEEVLEALGAVDRKVLFDLCGALFGNDIVSALNLLDDLYSRGYDLKRFYTQMLEHLRHLLIVTLDTKGHNLVAVPDHEIAMLKAQSEGLSLETIHQIFTMAFEAEASIRFSSQPRLALEALIVRLFQVENLVSLDHIIAGIDSVTKTLRLPEKKNGHTREEPPISTNDMAEENSGQQDNDVSTGPEGLAQTWKELLCLFDEQCKSLVPSLKNASLSKVGEHFIEITVEGNSFFSAMLRDEKNSAKMREVSSQFFGRNMSIRLAEKQRDNSRPGKPSGETDKARQLRKEALGHPIVTDALDVFQGTVVDIKIL
jgi:DNA polymerase-3 subunit gamma/tau